MQERIRLEGYFKHMRTFRNYPNLSRYKPIQNVKIIVYNLFIN